MHINPSHKPKRLKRAWGLPPCLTDRDAKIMEYIWKWKITSTASIHESFNRDQSQNSIYKILARLRRNGYIIDYFDPRTRFYGWSLTKYGFAAIVDELGELQEKEFLSDNLRRDRYVQAFQLGEWASRNDPRVKFFTDQELRRRPVACYPAWVPLINSHRPGGYTRLTGATRAWTYAFEVELFSKTALAYEGVIAGYKQPSGVDRVFWLINDESVLDAIKSAKANAHDNTLNYHVFVMREDFEKNGWDANVFNERSETLFTMYEKFRGLLGDPADEARAKFRGLGRVNVHLDGRKVLVNPKL